MGKSKYLVASLSLLVAIAGIFAWTNEASIGRDVAAPAVSTQRAPYAVRDTAPAKSVRPQATGAVVTPKSDGTNAELPNADHQPIGFTGYYKDTESGLYYANARYYDPRIARFTTPDPLEGTAMNPPSLHRYLYAYANPTVYTDPSGRCADALCSWGLGMAYAHDDDDRASVTRAALNTDPTLGRTAGAMYEAGMQFASPAQLATDAADALQGDLEAQRRWEQRADAVQAFGNRMQDARDRYGDAGPAVQIVSDFALRAGEHAAQVEVAGKRADYFGQGQSGLRIVGDLATVASAYGATQRLLGYGREMGTVPPVPSFSDTDVLRPGLTGGFNPNRNFDPGKSYAQSVDSFTSSSRVSARQSEIDVGNTLPDDAREQISFKARQEVAYGTSGSVRPDWCVGVTCSIEVKNYNIATNQQGLIRSVSQQAVQRQQGLPIGMVQKIVVDVRGQAVSAQQEAAIRTAIVERSNGAVIPSNILFKRD